jgi:hypothetical protein
MKLKKNNHGFGAIEGLLILVIVGIIGFTGWFVWDAKRNSEQSPINTTVAANSNAVAKTNEKLPANSDVTAKWFKYSSPDGIYTIKLPDGWNLVSYHGDSNPYAMGQSELTYTQGKAATVTSTDFAGDNIQDAFAMGQSWRSDIKGTKSSSFETNQGLRVDRYDYVVPKSEFQELKEGTTEYLYVVNGGNHTFQVVHDVSPGEKDSNSLIVDSLKTLVL